MSRMLYIPASILILYTCICILLYFLQEQLIFFPSKLDRQATFNFHTPFEEVFLQAGDGAEIHGLLFKANRPDGVILYFHGNAGNLAGWGYVAEDLTRYNYDVFIIDYRCFGKSTGNMSEALLHKDAQLCYNFLLERYPENDIVIYGRSIGSGIATRLASRNNPKLLILESPFYSLSEMASHYLPFLPNSILLKYNFKSHRYLKKVDGPVYIFHGDRDEVVPYKSGLKLARLIPEGQGKMITIQGGGHNNLNSFTTYKEALEDIL